MGFFVALIVSLAITIVGELLRPKTKPPNSKASGLDDFSLPTAEEGRSLPVFAGKVKIDGPSVTAYGDLESIAIKKKVKTGLFSSTKQTIGFRYYLGMQIVLGWGLDGEGVTLHELRFGDTQPRNTKTDEGNGCTRINFNDPNLFGGPEKEGGISGVTRFYSGVDEQTPNAYLADLVNEAVPAYKNLCYMVFEKMYLGTSAYIKTISAIVSRYPNQLGMPDDKHMIDEDCNPICFIYELMTDRVWAVGALPADIDVVAFRAAANTIYDEGFGMSLLYNGGGTAKDMIADILRHIDGVIFSDPETGLITIRLARGGYDIDTLPTFGPDDFLDGIEFSRHAWSETINMVKGTYVDRSADYNVAVIAQRDLANINQRGGEVSSEDAEFTGFFRYEPAAYAVARMLKTRSYPLAKMSGTLPRTAWKLKPADVIVINWPRRGIEAVVFRITSVRYNGLSVNTVTIEGVEDIFSISDVAYVAPPPSGWVNPVGTPQPLFRQAAAELPYALSGLSGSIIATYGSRTGGLDEGYEVQSDRNDGLGYVMRSRVAEFTPSGTIAAALPRNATDSNAAVPVVSLRHGAEIEEEEEGGLVRIVSTAGEEWAAYESFVAGEMINLQRGLFDTPSISHTAGATVWFVSNGFGAESVDPYTVATEVDIKLLPFNPRGVLPLLSATVITINTTQRGSRPLPPGRVRIGGLHPLLLTSDVVGTFVLTFAQRSRLTPEAVLQSSAGVEPEEGTTYNVRAYRADTDSLLAEAVDANFGGGEPNLTVQLAYSGQVRLDIEAKRDGLVSNKPQSFVIAYDGTGIVTSLITVNGATYVLDGGGA